MKLRRAIGLVLGLGSLALLPGWSRGQAPPAGEKPAAAAPDLAVRYRMQEHYVTTDTAPAGRIGPYRAAFRETIATVVEAPQSAPVRSEWTSQAIYEERPAEISRLEDRRVTAAVRRFETVRMNPEQKSNIPGPKLFEGLSVWIQPRVNDPPLVIVLTPDRKLHTAEYALTARQLFFPSLSLALPDLPVRVGDVYRVSPEGAEAILGTTIRQGNLSGKVQEIQDDPAVAGRKLMIFDLSGKVQLQVGLSSVHAQMSFAFTPGKPPAEGSVEASLGVLDAPGAIVKLSLAQESSSTVGETDKDRRRQFLRRELVAERRLGEGVTTLVIPKPAPEPTRLNSWLTLVEPKGRFQLEYPQEYQMIRNPEVPEDAAGIDLVHPRADGADVIAVALRPKSQLDGPTLAKNLFESYQSKGAEVVKGPAQWLPDADWPGFRVFRFEAAVVPNDNAKARQGNPPGQRIHLDGYILQSGRDYGLEIQSATGLEAPGEFRAQVEEVIRTVKFAGAVGVRPN